MLDQLQSRLAAYYARQSRDQPQVSPGPLKDLTGGWASSLYTFTIHAQESSDADAMPRVLKMYAPTARGRAHAEREWQALTRLRAAGYPVPRASLFEPDVRYLGSPFIVMEHVPARQLWDVLEQADQPRQAQLTRLFVARLVDLHDLAPQVLEPGMTKAHPYAFIEQELGQLYQDSQRSPHATLAEAVTWLEQRKETMLLHLVRIFEAESQQGSDPDQKDSGYKGGWKPYKTGCPADIKHTQRCKRPIAATNCSNQIHTCEPDIEYDCNHDVVVAADNPHINLRTIEHRLLAAGACKEGIWIIEKRAFPGLELLG
jgi:hypothetical protein